MKTDGRTFDVASHIAWRRVEDEVVVLDLNTSIYYSLNETAARVWELLADRQSAAAASRRVAEEYGEDVRSVERDVAEFLEGLRRENLLQPAAGKR